MRPRPSRRYPHRTRRTAVPVALAVALGLITAPAGVAAAAAPSFGAPDAHTAAARVLAAQVAAMELGPGAAAGRSAAGAEAAARRAEAGAGAPSLELQREGIGSSFDDEANAITYLRLVAPLNGPGQAGRARAFGREVGAWRGSAEAAAELAEAGRAGHAWLELAAASDRLAVTAARLDRLERALVIQRKRLELGEVSGSEVLQLELETMAEASRRRAGEVLRDSLAGRLAALAGGTVPGPRPGDLAELVAATRTAEDAEVTAGAASGPRVVAARKRAAAEAAASRLTRATAWGRPTVAVEWEWVPALGGQAAVGAAGVLLSVPLPLGAQGRRRVAAAELAAEAARHDLELARLEQEARLESARTAAVAAEATLAQLAPTLVRLTVAERSLEEQFRLGAISYLVLLDGLARLDGLRLEALESRQALLAARLELAHALADPSLFPIPTPTAPHPEEPS